MIVETYCGYCQKHYDEGLLAKNRVLYKRIGKPDKASSSLFEKSAGISCQVVAVD